jgi:hypothetical protein
MRKLGEDLSRANSRLSVARLELERLRRDAVNGWEREGDLNRPDLQRWSTGGSSDRLSAAG